MGLETANLIHELVETWPTGTDVIRDGDNHFRVMKRAIKGSFPNIKGVMTKSHTALNLLPDNWTAVLAELLKHVVPRGTIAAWSGSIASIPAGWALCNGQNVAGYGVVPDLRGRFVIGAGADEDPGDTGGAVAKVTSAAGGHTPSINEHTLTLDEIPQHFHEVYAVTGAWNSDIQDSLQEPNAAFIGEADAGGGQRGYIANNGSGQQLLSNVGGGDPHTHTADAVPNHTHTITDARPPWYALAYIIKTTQYVAP